MRKDVPESSFNITVTGLFGRNRKVKEENFTYQYGAPDMPFHHGEARAAISDFLLKIKAKPGKCAVTVERVQHTVSDYEYYDRPGTYTMRSTLIRIGQPRDILFRDIF